MQSSSGCPTVTPSPPGSCTHRRSATGSASIALWPVRARRRLHTSSYLVALAPERPSFAGAKQRAATSGPIAFEGGGEVTLPEPIRPHQVADLSSKGIANSRATANLIGRNCRRPICLAALSIPGASDHAATRCRRSSPRDSSSLRRRSRPAAWVAGLSHPTRWASGLTP
jgi:hypothetical protein